MTTKPGAAQAVETIRAAREIVAWLEAGQPLASEWECEGDTFRGEPRWLDKWPPNGVTIHRWLSELLAERDALVERVEAAERERDALAEAVREVLDYENVPTRSSLSRLRDALAAVAGSPPEGET